MMYELPSKNLTQFTVIETKNELDQDDERDILKLRIRLLERELSQLRNDNQRLVDELEDMKNSINVRSDSFQKEEDQVTESVNNLKELAIKVSD